jgi:hypothetical protein
MKDSTSNNLKFLESQSKKVSRSDTIGLFVIGGLVLNSIILLLVFNITGKVGKIADAPPPTLVQLADGTSITAATLGNKERSPQVVQNFVQTTLVKMFTWNGTKPILALDQVGKPEPDTGVDISVENGSGKKRIASAAYQASFALSEDFRKSFMGKVADLTPSDVFFNQGARSKSSVILLPLQIGAPKKLQDGEWSVPMVANLMFIGGKYSASGEIIPFNKEIFVRAVEIPKFANNGSADETSQIIYLARQSGLEIYAIRDLQRGAL